MLGGTQRNCVSAAVSCSDDVWVVAESVSAARSAAAVRISEPLDAVEVVQDDDVLDTWFSSALYECYVFPT